MNHPAIRQSSSGPAEAVIAMDLGTSGFRAQALALPSGEVWSTAITTRHPLPGVNVMDHLHFALELGVETARALMVQAINQVIRQLRVPTGCVRRLAVCGNPAQLSLFQGIEIRDLAFAGTRKLKALGVTPPDRAAAVRPAAEFPGLALPGGCSILIPPAVRDEVGADALALILQTGMLERAETAIAIDYGTNAEMALCHQGRVFTGSAAAGPALEGQHLSCGTLAAPGAIADLEPAGAGHRLIVLDPQMLPVPGAWIDLATAVNAPSAGPAPLKLTGTGTIAALDQALAAGAIVLPRIRTADQRLHFGPGVFLTEADLAEAGKAIGALRAGYCTLSREAGVAPEDIQTAYLAGASGTYVDALKAQRLGLVPPGVKTIRQIGNTSLAAAREMAMAPEKLDRMRDLARRLLGTHCRFASSKTFADAFLLELSYWSEGLPQSKHRELLRRFGLPDLPPVAGTPQIVRTVKRDIDSPGRLGLAILECIGRSVALPVEGCTGCRDCVDRCPSGALAIDAGAQPPVLRLAHDLCDGVACRRCETACQAGVFHLFSFFGASDRAPEEHVAAARR